MADQAPLLRWLFVKSSEQRLLQALLLGPPRRVWSRTELAKVCGQHPKARIDRHLAPLIAAGVIIRANGGYRVAPRSTSVKVLRRLLTELGCKPL
jgi:predicted transcriptional regulator